MMKMIISSMLIILSLIMFFMNNPLSMGLMIFTQTLLTCMLSGMLIKTYWFSYILFLIFLGGLLVMFIYVSSIASNELFKTPMMMKMMIIMILMMILFTQLTMKDNLNWLNLNNNLLELNNFSNMTFFNNENKTDINKLYNNQTSMMMMLMMIYLFITLIAAIKITNINYGPLRLNMK